MKALQGLLLSLFFLIAMSTAYADCMDSGCRESICSECECTDPVCLRGINPCITKSECCEAFGNVGAR